MIFLSPRRSREGRGLGEGRRRHPNRREGSAIGHRRMLAAQLRQYAEAHPVRLRPDVTVPEPDHSQTETFEVARAPLIVGDLVCVLPAVQLDHESGLCAEEVEDVWPFGNLAPPLPAAKPAVPQDAPQARFGSGLLTAQLTRAVAQRVVPEGLDVRHRRVLAAPRARIDACAAPHPTLSPLGFAGGEEDYGTS